MLEFLVHDFESHFTFNHSMQEWQLFTAWWLPFCWRDDNSVTQASRGVWSAVNIFMIKDLTFLSLFVWRVPQIENNPPIENNLWHIH